MAKVARTKHNKQGFTLVELSIVIIIIGLLIAGIAAGNSLTKQAALNSILIEEQQYFSAIQSFLHGYGYYPGDFPNAFSYWGTKCAATAAQCNGNGNGIIETNLGETANSWQHLVISGIISSATQYSGIPSLGLQVTSKFNSNVFWAIGETPGIYMIPEGTRNALHLSNNIDATNAYIPPTDAYLIDKKIDDGIPSNGNVMTWAMNNTFDCVLEADGITTVDYTHNSSNTTYSLHNSNPACYRIQFFLD